jgi:hypothetical protein
MMPCYGPPVRPDGREDAQWSVAVQPGSPVAIACAALSRAASLVQDCRRRCSEAVHPVGGRAG